MNNRLALDAQTIAQTIEALKLSFPELADDEEAWLLTLQSETDLTELMRKLEQHRREADAHAEALELVIKDYKLRKYLFGKREEAMRALAMKLLSAADIEKLQLPEATYSMRAVPPSVVILNEDELPDAACRFKREPDKTAIKQMLEVGDVPGATLSNGNRTLSIRVR
jgi:hypothetical protein